MGVTGKRESPAGQVTRVYPVVGGGPQKPPDYGRVVRAMTDRDIRDEIAGRLGGSDYQAALQAEAARRKKGA
jgi:hypothetical protein